MVTAFCVLDVTNKTSTSSCSPGHAGGWSCLKLHMWSGAERGFRNKSLIYAYWTPGPCNRPRYRSGCGYLCGLTCRWRQIRTGSFSEFQYVNPTHPSRDPSPRKQARWMSKEKKESQENSRQRCASLSLTWRCNTRAASMDSKKVYWMI